MNSGDWGLGVFNIGCIDVGSVDVESLLIVGSVIFLPSTILSFKCQSIKYQACKSDCHGES